MRTEQEVEADFANRHKIKAQTSTAAADMPEKTDELFGERKKSELLLLPSQIAAMKQVFERTDKYQDYILRRSEFLLALRTDEAIVDFVDADAIKCANALGTILTLDQVFTEVEVDEHFEQSGLKNATEQKQLNHK